MATIQKRKNSYLITASCGYDNQGRQIRKTMTWKPPSDMTEKQIEKELKRQAVLFDEQVRTGHYLSGNVKFADFIETWFRDYAETQLRPRTILAYKQLIGRTVEALGHLPLDHIQPQHLSAFYKNLAEPGIKDRATYICTVELKAQIKAGGFGINQFCELAQIADTTLRAAWNGQPIAEQSALNISNALGLGFDKTFTPKTKDRVLSANTIGHYHSFISAVLERAVKWNLILSNPCRRIDPPKIEKKTPQYLNEHEAARMLELLQVEDDPYRTIFILLLYTGMRRGELMGLEWKDIDFNTGVLSICRTSQYIKERGIFTDDVKNKSSHRSMKLPENIIDRLKQYKAWQLEESAKLGDRWQDTDRLFTTWDGAPMSPNSPYFWLQRFLARHDLPKINVHSLRHTNATLLISQGINVRTVAGRLGHSQTSTTMDIYSHELQSADAAAADALEGILGKNKNKPLG